MAINSDFEEIFKYQENSTECEGFQKVNNSPRSVKDIAMLVCVHGVKSHKNFMNGYCQLKLQKKN